MTSGNITRSLGLSALVIMSIAGLAITGSGAARANINPTDGAGIPTVTQNSANGDWDYAYNISVTDAQTVVYGSTFTFSDFYNFVDILPPTITNPSDWLETWSFNDPPAFDPNPGLYTYSSAYASVTFEYIGSTPIAAVGQSGTSLGTFTLESKDGYDGSVEQEFMGDADSGVPLQANANFTHYFAPTLGLNPGDGPPVQVTPEPGVFVTAASMLSMTGIGLVRGRRRSKGAKIAA